MTVQHDQSPIGDRDAYLFAEGTHTRLYEKLGAHPVDDGTHFAVWAPEAGRVSVIGPWNQWNPEAHPLERRGATGIWEGRIAGVSFGAHYKYHVRSRDGRYRVDKADPFAFRHEVPPGTASVVESLEYTWRDGAWMKDRKSKNGVASPMTIYEVHLGSWRRVPEEKGRPLTYLELARELPEYVAKMGFTHVELMPVMEHPFYGSWGYQITGYFAPTSRYGAPRDLMALVDALHQRGIGVILDWVPSHFPTDAHGLGFFDGTHLFEHADPRQGFHPDWKSAIFNYGRHEVRSFLLSNALYWLERFHIDGLRVDAVASMLYLDYSRKPGEWIPNRFGGRENLDAIHFLQRVNAEVYGAYPDALTIAEESTAWPLVSRPVYLGGLGFGMKWDMGWMHDTLAYFGMDPIHRKFHHGKLTFRMMYAYSENYVLPLSHDEVVHGKGSLYGRMPGDPWRKRANLRLLLAYMYGQPGKKLLFMGGELGQVREWNHDASLDWHLLEEPGHAGIQRWVIALNELVRSEPALHELDTDPEGFEWIDCSDVEQSVVVFLRKGRSSRRQLVVACNFTPLPRHGYAIGVPHAGPWCELLNSDATEYGGSGVASGLDANGVTAEAQACHGRSHRLVITLPPLGALFFVGEAEAETPVRVAEAA